MRANQLRKILMLHGEAVKPLMPTDMQRRIFTTTKMLGQTDSETVAKTYKISVAAATAHLKALYDKGYLTREDVGDPTGGRLFVYKPIKWG